MRHASAVIPIMIYDLLSTTRYDLSLLPHSVQKVASAGTAAPHRGQFRGPVPGPLTGLAGVLSRVVALASVTGGAATGTTGVASLITGWAWVGASERDTSELSTGAAGLSEPDLRVGKVSVGSWDDDGVAEGAVNHDG